MPPALSPRSTRALAWSVWVVAALLLLPVLGGAWYATAVAGSALLMAAVPGTRPRVVVTRDDRDLVAIGLMYLAVVGSMSLAFRVFTTANTLGLFLCFAVALLVGSVGPVVYTVWFRRAPLRDLGLRVDNWRPTVALALLFAGVQFALTLWGLTLPADPEDWVPLLVMALVVGVFESLFFRGFVQARLEARFGPVRGIAAAAALYGLYHVGYGMGLTEIGLLLGLGVVYGVAFALVRNVLVLWPLLTPLGSFFANVRAGDIHLPWASILGFLDVLAVVVVVVVVAARRERRRRGEAAASR